MIYLDNAATSWPKPERVYRATDHALRTAANPGRGGHRRSRDSAHLVLQSRETVARFFGVTDSRQIIFTAGATASLNQIIYGVMPGARRILSLGFEHNALWRPLEDLTRNYGVTVKYANPLEPQGFNWGMVDQGLREKPDLVAITHASNVTGQVYPVVEIARRAKEAGVLVCVDVSQTAGVLAMNFEEMGIDFAAFPGHKGLLGPPGVGGLYIRAGAPLRPLCLGGTGANSHAPFVPTSLPERYESGTMNIPGIVGMAAGIEYLVEQGLANVLDHELALRQRAQEGLKSLGAVLYGDVGPWVGVLAFNLPGIDSTELAYILDDIYGICLRGGLHCAPRAHEFLGTTISGATRISPGLYNTEAEIDQLLATLQEIQQMMR